MYPEYPWASNQVKILRAKEQLANENKLLPPDSRVEITEQMIKDRYIKLGGLVLNVEEEEVEIKGGNVQIVKKSKKKKGE